MQRTSGIYRLTQIPTIYALLQNILVNRQTRQIVVTNYLQPRQGERILDIGCGPAAFFPLLGDVQYLGIDHNARHITLARKLYGGRANFMTGDLKAVACLSEEAFDAVFCIGVFHHLDDTRLVELCRLASARLVSGGRLIGIDPTFVDDQHWIARRLAAADSGRFVRSPAAYKALLLKCFARVDVVVRHDLMRVPYTHCISTAHKT